jgi:predicted component of type VI protein secretion system
LGILIINLIGLSMFLLRTTPGRRFARQGVKAARTAVYRARTGIFQNREKAGQTIGTLTVQKGIKGVKTITINRSRFIVGRQIAAGCNYEIPFEFVSSQHFTIFFRNDRFSIMDMNSANGTRLNGRRLRPSQHVPLQNGATIAIVDRVVLEFKTDIKTADEPIIKTEPIAPILADEAPPARGAAGLRPAFSENQNPVEDDPQQKSKRQTANWESLGGSDPNDISGDWDPFKKD